MRPRTQTMTAVALASLALVGALLASSGCIALVCFDADPCAHGGGGASSGTQSTTGTMSTSMSTSMSNSSSVTSTSTGAACADPTGCNGVDCLGGACVGCLCEPVALDFALPVGRIAAGDVNVYVAGGTSPEAKLYAVPKKFDPATPVAGYAMSPVPDADGFVAASGTNVAYSPSSDGHLVLCAAGACASSAQSFGPRATGLAFDFTALQIGVAPPTNGVGTYKPFSTNPPTIIILINDSPGTGLGVHTVRSLSGTTYWSDLDGCLYAAANNIVGSASCLSLNGIDLHTADFVVGSAGLFLAETAGAEIYRVDVNLPQQKGVASFVPDENQVNIKGTGPLGIDATRLFVGQPTGIAVYTYLANGSPLVTVLPTVGPVTGIDASDPKVLFYTAGQMLYRWAKPKP